MDDACRYMWMLDLDNPEDVMRGCPMYTNCDSAGCGRTNNGERPRLEGTSIHHCSATANSDCALASVR